MQQIQQRIKRIDLNELVGEMTGIAKLRTTARAEALKEATTNLYNYLKSLNYGVIDRKFLNSFFGDDVKRNVRAKVLKVILNELIKEGKIRKTKKIKTTTCFRTSTLYTNDYGSYAVLMEKNEHKPRHKQGVYSLSSLSVRKVKQPVSVTGYEVI